MRSYTVTDLCTGQRAEAVRSALAAHYGEGVTIKIDQAAGSIRIDGSADPQIVAFLIEGAGCTVIAVGDAPGEDLASRQTP